MKKTYEILIHATIEKVFSCLEDEDKIRQWMDGRIVTEYLTTKNPENPIGTRFKQKIEGITEFEGSITEFERPKLLTVEMQNSTFKLHVSYKLEPAEKGTKLYLETSMSGFDKYTNIITGMLEMLANSAILKQIQSIKKLAEETGLGTPEH